MSQSVKNALLSPYQLPDSCPPLRRHLTVNGSNLKSWNALGENSDFHHFHHFNRLPKWFRTRLFCTTFHWSVSRWFSMFLTIFSLLLKVTLIMLSPPGSSGACVPQIPTELGIRISPKKTRLSKEMKPDGLICIGIFLPPSISGIRLSSLLGVRTEGWNKRSTYQARDALFPSAILSTWHWALRILNTACARVAMSQAHSLVDIELRIGENSSESVFFCRLLTILKSLWKVVSNGCLFLEVTDSEALSMGWKEADLDTLKDHHLCSLSSIRLSKQYSPMLLIDLLFLLTWLVSLPREAV